MAVIMMLSGLRRGELVALTWADVDLKGKTITVNKTMEYPPNQPPKLRPLTKSAAGMRTVDIPQRLADYMAAMPRDNVMVIHTTQGRVMTATAWEALWKSYMRLLNIKYGTRTPDDQERMKMPGQRKFDMTIPPITLHWLRHTFCTLLYLARVDVVQACAQMGHADVSTTLRSCTNSRSIQIREPKLPMARQKIAGILCVFQDLSTQPSAIWAAKLGAEAIGTASEDLPIWTLSTNENLWISWIYIYPGRRSKMGSVQVKYKSKSVKHIGISGFTVASKAEHGGSIPLTRSTKNRAFPYGSARFFAPLPCFSFPTRTRCAGLRVGFGP